MKKKIINGILMVALLFAATTSFVSCKDNVDDELIPVYAELTKQKNDLSSRISALEGQISGLQAQLNQNTSDITDLKGSVSDLQGKINGLTTEVNDLKGRLANVESQIATLSADVDTIKNQISEMDSRITVLQGQVEQLVQFLATGLITDVAVNHTVNDLIGSINIPGLNIKALAALFGDNQTYIEKFPVAGKDYNVDQDNGSYLYVSDLAGAEFIELGEDFITKPNGNGGKMFFTVNCADPSLFDINDWTLSIENSAGATAPVEIYNVRPSSYQIQWGLYKSQVLGDSDAPTVDNGFYEASVTIQPQYLEQCQFDTKKFIDLKEIKDRFKTAVENIKEAKKSGNKFILAQAIGKEAAQILINFYSGKMSSNNTDLQNPTWSAQRLVMQKITDDGTVRAQAADIDLALTSIAPLSYNSFWELEKNAKAPNYDLLERAVNRLAKAIKGQLPSAKFTPLSKVTISTTVNSISYDDGTGTVKTLDIDADILDPIREAINGDDGMIQQVNDMLADLEKEYDLGGKVDNIADRVTSYLEKAGNYIVTLMNKHELTRAISPIILFNGAEGIDRMYDGIKVNKGYMQIMMTSPTEELLVPAYEKFIAVTSGGKVLQSATVPGNTQSWVLDLTKPGNYYVVLSCVDYYGYVVTKRYEVTVLE